MKVTHHAFVFYPSTSILIMGFVLVHSLDQLQCFNTGPNTSMRAALESISAFFPFDIRPSLFRPLYGDGYLASTPELDSWISFRVKSRGEGRWPKIDTGNHRK